MDDMNSLNNNEKKVNLFNRANELRIKNEFDKDAKRRGQTNRQKGEQGVVRTAKARFLASEQKKCMKGKNIL